MFANKFLKTAILNVALVLSVLSLGFIAACSDDEEAPAPVTLDFAATARTVSENAGAQTLTVNLSSAAFRDGSLSITATPANANTMITFPTGIDIAEGQTAAQFTVTPINNAAIDGNKTITFTLADPTDGFVLGTAITFTLTILDDEGPVNANFETESSSTNENNAEGIAINIILSDNADEAGEVIVSFPAEFAAAFTSDPEAVNNTITLPIAVGENSASFTITPVNGTDDNEAPLIPFTISNATGGVVVGTNVTHTLTIVDDDDAVLTTIAAVRALFQGSNFTITDNIYIQGVIISSNSNLTNRNAFIQDATGGIALRFNANNTLTRGDEVTVNLKDATLSEFNGLLQAGGDLPNANAVKIGDGTLPAYQTITLTQLLSGDFEGQLVRVENVGFFDANGTNDLGYNGGSGSGNNRIGDAAGNISFVRVESYAPFDTDKIPYGLGTVQGIANQTGVGYNILPMESSDIFTGAESAIINPSAATLDFGDVANGASADLTFTVSGTLLVGDVVVTSSPAAYTISTDNVTFGSSVTITDDAANAGNVTVYVRFAPTSGTNQAITGSLTLKSLSAGVKTVDLTGNEVGNAALQTLALWTFEVSVPAATNQATLTGLVAEEGTNAANSFAAGVHVNAATDYSNPAGNGSLESFSSNEWAIGDYYQFTTSTTGFEDIVVSFDQTRSSSGPATFGIAYSTDGTNFTEFAEYTVGTETWSTSTPGVASSFSYNMSALTALNNVATVTIRLVAKSAPSSTGGTNRVDNVRIAALPQ